MNRTQSPLSRGRERVGVRDALHPTALLVALVFLASACVDLSPPRAYRCTASSECVEPWVCLRDGYCHDPSVGVPVECASSADCTAGWFCGKDTRCHDPQTTVALPCDDDTQCPNDWFCAQDGVCHDRAVPMAFPCTDDTHCAADWFCAQDNVCHDPSVPAALPCVIDSHCAGGWRCSIEGRCVDTSLEAPAPTRPDAPGATTRVSPLTPQADRLYPSPTINVLFDGGVVVMHQAALVIDGGLYASRVYQVVAGAQQAYESALRRIAWDGGFTDVALLGEIAVIVDERHQPWLLEDPPVLLSGVQNRVSDAIPMKWPLPDGGQGLGFAFTAPDAPTTVWHPKENSFPLYGKGPAIDVAALDEESGALRLVIASVSDTGVSTLETWLPEVSSGAEIWAAPDPRVSIHRLWVENYTAGVLTEDATGINGSSFAALRFKLGNIRGGPDLLDPPAAQCTGGALVDVSVRNVASTELVCRATPDTTTVWTAPGQQPAQALREYVSTRSAGLSNGHVRQSEEGVLRFGEGLDVDVPDLLDVRPDRLAVYDGALVALRGRALYRQQRSDGGFVEQGLHLTVATSDDDAGRIVGFVEGSSGTVLNIGAIAGELSDGGSGVSWFFEGLPRLSEPVAREFPTSAGRVLVCSEGDTLWAGANDGSATGVVRPAVKPAPGFPVTSWTVTTADAGLLEGWATANNRLFRVTATAVDRWKVTELPVTNRDPLHVFRAGDAVRLGTTTGEVLSLPSRVPVAPALGDVTSLDGVCGAVVATTDDGAYQLVTDGGWALVPGTEALRRPRVHRTERRLLISSETGVVLELDVDCAP